MALRLKRNAQPVWVNLYDGGAVFANPPSTPLVYAARARAAAIIADLLASGSAITKVGAHIVGMPDLTDQDEVAATTNAMFALSLAEIAVTDWRNVYLDDDEAHSIRARIIGASDGKPECGRRLSVELSASAQ